MNNFITPNETTYGEALLLGSAVEMADVETIKFVASGAPLVEIMASTYMFIMVCIGKHTMFSDKEDIKFDYRTEAKDYFIDVVSKEGMYLTALMGENKNLDDVNTALTTIVMGEVLPLIEQASDPYATHEFDGLEEDDYVFLYAFLSYAAMKTVQHVAPVLEGSRLQKIDNPAFSDVTTYFQDVLKTMFSIRENRRNS